MARPKKALEIADADITIAEPVEAGWAKPDEILPEVMLAKTVQLHVGVDLLGSKASLQSGRMATLEVHEYGIIAISKKNNRKVLIPWTNIRGCELL